MTANANHGTLNKRKPKDPKVQGLLWISILWQFRRQRIRCRQAPEILPIHASPGRWAESLRIEIKRNGGSVLFVLFWKCCLKNVVLYGCWYSSGMFWIVCVYMKPRLPTAHVYDGMQGLLIVAQLSLCICAGSKRGKDLFFKMIQRLLSIPRVEIHWGYLHHLLIKDLSIHLDQPSEALASW